MYSIPSLYQSLSEYIVNYSTYYLERMRAHKFLASEFDDILLIVTPELRKERAVSCFKKVMNFLELNVDVSSAAIRQAPNNSYYNVLRYPIFIDVNGLILPVFFKPIERPDYNFFPGRKQGLVFKFSPNN